MQAGTRTKTRKIRVRNVQPTYVFAAEAALLELHSETIGKEHSRPSVDGDT